MAVFGDPRPFWQNLGGFGAWGHIEVNDAQRAFVVVRVSAYPPLKIKPLPEGSRSEM